MWVNQELVTGNYRFHLFEDYVAIEELIGPKPKDSVVVTIYPASREDANRLSIALKMASRRMEEIGKGLP